uniref:L1 transposable element RRM domain-containing protein n=1 Tax=Poecilia latipinna TaxID=48699 RepID=A0A3B3US68_9TELE
FHLKLSSTVDMRFVELNGSISSLKAALSDISDRVTSTEAAVVSRIDGFRSWRSNMILSWRIWRQNIRIVGIQEKAENDRPTDFVCKLLREDNFDRPMEVDRAHRSLTQAKDGKARAIIVRLHYFQEKERVLRLAREKGPLQYDGRLVFIFPDLTSAVMKKRQTFQAIREQCRAKGTHYGFGYPAQFLVTVNNNTATFDTPVEADKFLSREIEDWQSGTK